MHALLINDTSRTPNVGGRANAFALKRMLAAAGVDEISSIYGYDIEPYVAATKYQLPAGSYLSLFVPPVLTKIKNKVLVKSHSGSHKIPSRWDEFDAIADLYLKQDKYRSVIRLIKSVDMVIVNGEGTIYGDRDESLFILFLAYLAKKYLHKPTHVINHTLDAKGGELRKVVDNVYPLLNDIVFREYTSLNNFRQFSNARFAADACFVYEAAPKEQLQNVANRRGYYNLWPYQTYDFNPDKPYICITGSSAFFRNDMKFLDPTFDFVELCRGLKEEFDQVICISSDLPDESFLKEVTESLNLPLISCRTSHLQIIDILSNAQTLISGRWHSAIYALSNGVPVVAFSAHNFKMRALFDLMGINDEIYKADRLGSAKSEIIRRTKYYSRNEKIKKKLLKRATALRKSAYENVRFVRNT